MKINEDNFEPLRKAEEITGVDSGVVWTDAENIEGYVTAETLYNTVQDLLVEIGRLEEEKEDIIRDRDENYDLKPFNPYEEYGINEKDFH